ncbi:uncharacterized protein A4U43_C01F5960 [Asparagus officinalis]|uniref:Rhodanese domain-containing protein n=1 Tax=Asparagus officinalis TaxID=4686 RepID=A0A5P1FQX9_ASPOF|nr:calcium sensing receptor, chloroplastic [Asparagus officinalis]ONK79399.1 uncharacterized protein A4U43_C01F5960 [Asparagus officinalis]
MALAFRATAAIRIRPPPQSKPKPKPNKHSLLLPPPPPPPPQNNEQHSLVSSTSTTAISFLALLSIPNGFCEAKAFAFSKEDIVSSLTKVEDTIDQVGGAGSKALDFSQQVIKVLGDTLKPAVDVAVPMLQSAGEEALKIASPVVSDASKQAKEALQSAGVDPSPVLSAAKTFVQQTPKVIEGAKPIASATVKTITSSDPSVIVVSAGALFVAYLLLPSVWSAITFNFRGYKGNLSPAQTLDLISTQNYIMIDIRSEKEKNKAGIPRLPSGAKNKMIAVPVEELPSKIKGLVRNTKRAEAEITALKISYLKRVNKSSNIVILDSYSDISKIVAKSLTSLGFKNCWIVTDGFSGGRGWLQSRLGVDTYNVSLAEVLSPSRIIPARFGTTSSTALQPSRELLPGE